MLTLQDQRAALQTVSTLMETVRERPVAVVVIGENGCERIWLAEDLENKRGKEWAAKHVRAAVDSVLLKPRPSKSEGADFSKPQL